MAEEEPALVGRVYVWELADGVGDLEAGDEVGDDALQVGAQVFFFEGEEGGGEVVEDRVWLDLEFLHPCCGHVARVPVQGEDRWDGFAEGEVAEGEVLVAEDKAFHYVWFESCHSADLRDEVTDDIQVCCGCFVVVCPHLRHAEGIDRDNEPRVHKFWLPEAAADELDRFEDVELWRAGLADLAIREADGARAVG